MKTIQNALKVVGTILGIAFCAFIIWAGLKPNLHIVVQDDVEISLALCEEIEQSGNFWAAREAHELTIELRPLWYDMTAFPDDGEFDSRKGYSFGSPEEIASAQALREASLRVAEAIRSGQEPDEEDFSIMKSNTYALASP